MEEGKDDDDDDDDETPLSMLVQAASERSIPASKPFRIVLYCTPST